MLETIQGVVILSGGFAPLSGEESPGTKVAVLFGLRCFASQSRNAGQHDAAKAFYLKT